MTSSAQHGVAPLGKGASVTQLLSREHDLRLSSNFGTLDALVATVMLASLRRERVLDLVGDQADVRVLDLSGDLRAVLGTEFNLVEQEAHGAWFLPPTGTIRVGVANLPAMVTEYGRFGVAMAWDWASHRAVKLANSSDALFAWAVLEPLFAELFLPVELRGPASGDRTRERQFESWAAVDRLMAALEVDVLSVLAGMRYGAGWSRLREPEQAIHHGRYLDALAENVTRNAATRYRGYRIRALVERYYEKANKDGQATRKQVVTTAAAKQTLAGYFLGDWLRFLAYIGETPHPREQVVTALPKARLHVGWRGRLGAVAEAQALPISEIGKITSALFPGHGGVSPVEEREDALKTYWRQFDEIHARQRSGGDSLWGLVEEHDIVEFGIGPTAFQPRLYRRLLSADVLHTANRLWPTVLLPRFPERLVTEPFPQYRLSQTFGPALSFWHGISLTAWFVCEGPMSRTDIPGMRTYYLRELEALKIAGAPVRDQLFQDLEDAEKRLGPPSPIPGSTQDISSGPRISITVNVNPGTRRDGFDVLRDIVTLHRRDWTRQYLDAYLRQRWEADITGAHKSFHRLYAERGRPPTARQFAAGAESASNCWFAGNIRLLYEAIGERAPLNPVYQPLLPSVTSDIDALGRAVFAAIGGDVEYTGYVGNPTAEERAYHQKQNALRSLAGHFVWYFQLEEALGRPPDLPEFGRSKIDRIAQQFGEDVSIIWRGYQLAMEAVRPGSQPSETLDVATFREDG